MKILILSIYNDNEVYSKFLELQKKYIHSKDNIEAYFITYGNHEEEILVKDNIISFKGEEGYMKITQKTIMALDYLINVENRTYDYVIRTNISTIIHLDNLVTYLENEPRENLYAGGLLFSIDWMDYNFGINEDTTQKYNLHKFVFAQGTSIVLSFDVAKYILDNHELIHYEIIDDVAIGLLLRDHKPEAYNSIFRKKPQRSINSYEKDAIFIRNRSIIDDDRGDDIERMSTIISTYFSM